MIEFLNSVKQLLENVEKDENKKIQEVAKIVYNTLEQNKLVHVFATGHSHMFCEELFYRSGGLAGINPIFVGALMQHEGALRSTKLERIPNLAKAIFDSVDILEDEPMIIVSNSGINSVPVEMAEIAKATGHKVIAITSLASSKNSTPRTLSGNKLYEVADIVIDNHVPYSDGVFDYQKTKIGAVSSIIGSYIAQNIVLEVIKLYQTNDKKPPIYQSANTPGGDEHNKALYELYKGRIKALY